MHASRIPDVHWSVELVEQGSSVTAVDAVRK
jgi:hypothetical protein